MLTTDYSSAAPLPSHANGVTAVHAGSSPALVPYTTPAESTTNTRVPVVPDVSGADETQYEFVSAPFE